MASWRARGRARESKREPTASRSAPPRRPEQANALVSAQARDASQVRSRFAERHTAIMSAPDELYSRLPLLELLGSCATLGEEIRDECDDLIVLCRARGATWAQIALPLQVSRQAAQQRYTARVQRTSAPAPDEPEPTDPPET